MTPSAEQFRSYGILMVDVAAEFYTWIEQWLNGSPVLSLGLFYTFTRLVGALN
jgi:hypothetical protein